MGPKGWSSAWRRPTPRSWAFPLVITPVSDLAEMRAWLADGRADIAAAQLTADETLLKVGDAAQPYEEVEQLVVYKRGENRPKGTIQLESAKLAVRAGSPQERVLQKLKGTVAPTIEWVATAPVSADPMDDVESGPGELRHRRCAGVFVRAAPLSERRGRLHPARHPAGAVDRAEARAGPPEVGQRVL